MCKLHERVKELAALMELQGNAREHIFKHSMSFD